VRARTGSLNAPTGRRTGPRRATRRRDGNGASTKIVQRLARRSVRHPAMAMLSLLEAAKEVGKSKSSIWRAARSGALSVTKNDAGQILVDSSELFRVFQAKRSEPRVMTQDAAVHVTHEGHGAAPRRRRDKDRGASCNGSRVAASARLLAGAGRAAGLDGSDRDRSAGACCDARGGGTDASRRANGGRSAAALVATPRGIGSPVAAAARTRGVKGDRPPAPTIGKVSEGRKATVGRAAGTGGIADVQARACTRRRASDFHEKDQ